jgi:hypothetical protein
MVNSQRIVRHVPAGEGVTQWQQLNSKRPPEPIQVEQPLQLTQ